MAANKDLYTPEIVVHLDSLEDCILEVRMQGPAVAGLFADPLAASWNDPVCGAPCPVPVYAWIMYNNAGAAPCNTPAGVNAALRTVNAIWAQCATPIQFNLNGIGQMNSTADQNIPNDPAFFALCGTIPAATRNAVNVFFVCSIDAGATCGETNAIGGCCVAIAAPTVGCCPDIGVPLAHEFGHVLGLDHVEVYCNLMQSVPRCCSTLSVAQCSTALSVCQDGHCW